jgi:hypothetical protein
VKPSRDELRARLEGHTPPAPHEDFVNRLANRLRAIDPSTTGTHVPVFRRPPWRGFVALAAAAAAVALLFGVLPNGGHDPRLDVTGRPPAGQPEQGEPGTTAPPAPSTTTVPGVGPGTTIARAPAVGPVTTLAPRAANNPIPSLPAGPATTQRPTDTTRRPGAAPTTTTTAPAEPEALTLSCVAGQPEGSPGVQCDWSQSTAPAFYAYRLWRATGTGAKQSIYAVSNRTTTRYIDRPSTGLQHYMVEAVDNQGRVAGRSPVVEVTCC